MLMVWFCVVAAQAQIETRNSGVDGLQWGVAGKVQVEFNFRNNPNFRLSLSGGIGYDIDAINFFPAIHSGVMLFNKGPIGSYLERPWHQPQFHFFLNTSGTIAFDKGLIPFAERYVPFYHFSDFTANPLHNPYKTSTSYGAIWVFMPRGMRQRIGFFNLNVVGRTQITYYNDGGPVLKWVGDKRDRYYTGGVLFSYHGNRYTEFNLIELSYHKFTGYTPYAFDVGDKLQIDYVLYADKQQFAFNQQRWKIGISNYHTGFGGNFSLYNVNSLDVQDLLHFSTQVPYHPDYYNGWRWMLGGKYEYNYTYLQQ
ncbi:MAG: hypothetical protein HKO54_10630 [Flavobacteriaceae bacterium]|nr:hypothetical protein [Flavobacteriaceae bacterium]